MMKQWKQYTALAIAVLMVAGTIFNDYISSANITVKEVGFDYTYHFVILYVIRNAGILLIVNLALIPLARFPKFANLWKYFFIVVVLSTFSSWVSFLPTKIGIFMGFFRLDFLGMILIWIHLSVNPDLVQQVKQIFTDSEQQKAQEREVKENEYERRVLDFERKFDKKSTEELERIVSEKKLISEAVLASERILKRR